MRNSITSNIVPADVAFYYGLTGLLWFPASMLTQITLTRKKSQKAVWDMH